MSKKALFLTVNNTLPPNFSVVADRINFLYNGNSNVFAANWTSTNGSSFTGNTAVAPDGTTTATTFTSANTSSTSYNVNQLVSGQNTSTLQALRLAVYAKANTLTRIALQLTASGNGQYAGFDLGGGQIAYGAQQVGTAGPQVTNQAIINKGNGWYLCYVDFAVPSLSSGNLCSIFLDFGAGVSGPALTHFPGVTSGIFLWKTNLLPPAVWNFAGRIFTDDFTSLATIDTTASFAPGFNWYPFFRSDGGGVSVNQYAVNNSILSLTCTSPTFGQGITTSFINRDTNALVGTFSFTPPFCAEFSVAVDPTLAPATQANSAWPAVWTISGNLLFPLVIGDHYEEHDMLEFPTSGVAGTPFKQNNTNSWVVGTGPPQASHHMPAWNDALGEPTFNNTTFHTYHYLFLPASVNGGTSTLKITFFDGVVVANNAGGFAVSGSDFMWNSSTGVTDPSSFFNTGYPEGETQTYPLILTGGDPGIPWPLNIDYISVYK